MISVKTAFNVLALTQKGKATIFLGIGNFSKNNISCSSPPQQEGTQQLFSKNTTTGSNNNSCCSRSIATGTGGGENHNNNQYGSLYSSQWWCAKKHDFLLGPSTATTSCLPISGRLECCGERSNNNNHKKFRSFSTSVNKHRSMAKPNMQSNSPVIFRQLFDNKSFTYTYLLACMRTKEVVLIDPVLELVRRDMIIIEQLGLSLKYAINTHVHADHITGSGILKQKLPGAMSVLGIDSGAKADMYVDQGAKIQFGDIEMEARKTPGHTNGCMSFVWHDQKCVFSGDAVLIRGCGRTDFQQGSSDTLYTSVHSQIFSLPEDYVIYPAHDYTGQPWTTVGEEKRYNPRLTKTRDEFIELMNNLNLPYPKQIDRALPANLLCGVVDEPPEASSS